MKYLGRVIIVALLIASLTYLLLSSHDQVRRQTLEDLHERQAAHARQAARGIESFIRYYVGVLEHLAMTDDVIRMNDRGRSLLRFFFARSGGEIQSITRVNEAGRFVYTLPDSERYAGTDISQRDFFQTMRRTGKPVVSDIIQSVKGYRAIAFHVPVFREGIFSGSVAFLVSPEGLAERHLKDIRIGKSGYAWMISDKGVELYCPVPGHIGKTVQETSGRFPSVISMAERMVRGEEGVATYTYDRIRGDRTDIVTKHAVFMPVRILDRHWSIVVAAPEDEVLESMKGFRNRWLLFSGLLMASFLLLFHYLFKALGILREDGKRRAAEEALRESERRLADIIAFLPDATFVIDRNRAVIAWNRAMEELTGISAKDMVGRSGRAYAEPFYGEPRPILIDLVLDRDGEMERRYRSIERRGPLLAAEAVIPSFRGREAILWGVASPLYDRTGSVVGAIESIRDVTDQRRAENALRISEERYRTILEDIEEGYVETDPGGRFTFCNDSFLRILGAEGRDIAGLTFRDFGDAETVENLPAEFDALLREGKPIRRLPLELRRGDGSRRTVEISAFLMSDGQGGIRGIRSVVQDVTEKRQMEAHLLQAQKMEAVGTLAGGIAHNFNNLLMIIQGYASLLEMDLPPGEHPWREKIRQIEGQIRSGSELTKQLLGFARKGKYETRPVRLNELLERGAGLFGQTRREIRIHRIFDPGLWTVLADPGQIEQVLLNLFVNAWQAMPAGGDLFLETGNVLLDDAAAALPWVAPGRYVRIGVTDTGMGMDEETKKRIFEPFFTTREIGRGSGLGLASAYGIVKNHQGFIQVDSAPGKGATFRVYLPAADVPPPALAVEPSPPPPVAEAGTVLLVDDEPAILDVGRTLLASLGYDVLTAGGGEEAVEIFRRNPQGIDVVILDMIMPGMGGGETFERLRAIRPDAAVVLASGYGIDGMANEILQKGCRAFLQKPFTLTDLSSRIRDARQTRG